MGILRNISQNNVVFVVEDNKVYRELIGAKIQALANVEVKLFSSAEEAIKEVAQAPKLIVLDLYLDGDEEQNISGHEAIEAFASWTFQPEVILISGAWNFDLLNEYRTYRKLDFILKSDLSSDVLERKVKNALSLVSTQIESI